MKILITGSNGQLGKTLKENFNSNKDFELVFTTREILDITKEEDVNLFFKEHNFQYCINCAAYTNVEKAEEEPSQAFLVNAEAVKNLAIACKKNNTVLIHISTDYVFDGKKRVPYSEEDITNPINQYGKSKLLGERYIQSILNKYYIIRSSWLYSMYQSNFLKNISKKIQENSELKITISQTGTPTSCEQLANFIQYIIFNNKVEFGIYNFSAKGEATWYDFAFQITKHYDNYNISNLVPVDVYNTKAQRPAYSVLNNTKAIKVYDKINSWQYDVDYMTKKMIENMD